MPPAADSPNPGSVAATEIGAGPEQRHWKADSDPDADSTHSDEGIEFGVIIPTFNRAHLLKRAIDSALGQTLRPRQVIVVDDGSRDNTADLCAEYGDRIEFIRQENSGVAAARNTGIRRVGHAWTAFLDSDDYWAPDHLARVADAIRRTAGRARYYFSDMRLPTGAGAETLWAKIGFGFLGPFLVTEDATAWLMSQREPCSIQSSVFQTDVLRKCGGFDPRYRVTEDRELFCRVGIGGTVCAVNAVGCIQTADDLPDQRLGGILHVRSVGYWEHDCMLWEDLRERFPDMPAGSRRALHCSLAIAYWRLSRLHWRARRFGRSTRDLMRSARADPALLFWLLRHGRSAGWEANIILPPRAR